MKIIDAEEKAAHRAHILSEGFKGLFVGGLVSVGLYGYLRTRQAARFRQFTPSMKACVFAMPTIAMGAFYADQGSVEFDREMHSSDYNQKLLMEKYKELQKMSITERTFHTLNENKYSIIIASWAGSLYGSWVLVNRDKIMTTAQKAVQARMYAQGITIILLLGTILLAMKEEELNKNKPPPVPEWQRILQEKEEDEAERKKMIEKIRAAKAEVEEVSQ